MAQGLAYARRLFPEEIVLWGINSGDCCLANESFQRGVCDSALALRELRLQIIELTGQRDALLANVRAFEPVHLRGFVPVVGGTNLTTT